MLEYCLKQERAKNYRLTHNGEDPPVYEEETSIPGTCFIPNFKVLLRHFKSGHIA